MLKLGEYKKIDTHHLQALNDRELMRYSEQRHVIHTPHSVSRYVEQVDYFKGVYLNDRLIGTVAGVLDKPNDVMELGILVWKKGYGRKAWDLALSKLDHRLVVAGCMACNLPMRSILDQTMVYDHTRTGILMYHGEPMSTVHYRR